MTADLRDRLGRFGVWRPTGAVTPDLAAAVERLGFGALWIGRSPDGDLAVPERRTRWRTSCGRTWTQARTTW